MRGFYEALLARYATPNDSGFDFFEAESRRKEKASPSRIEVAHALYADTSMIDLDKLAPGGIDLLVLNELGVAHGGVRDTLITALLGLRGDREIDLMIAHTKASDSFVSELIAKARDAVILVCYDEQNMDPRLHLMAHSVWYASVNQIMIDRLTRHVWPDQRGVGDNRLSSYDTVDLTDVLVALRGAVSLADFYLKLFSVPEVEQAKSDKDAAKTKTVDPIIGSLKDLGVTVPRIPEHVKLSEMSGFGAAQDWGLRLANDLTDYRNGKIPWADVDKGVLLSSPPGGGKTTFAKALAAECECPLIATTYGDWAGKDGGGDAIQRTLTKKFAEWRKLAESGPIIVLVDEIDSIGKRGKHSRSDYWFGPIINSWLAFLDGAEPRDGIVVIAATNHPDRVDDALLRPGRLDRHVVIPAPTKADVAGMIAHHTPLDVEDPRMPEVVAAVRGMSPAQIEQVCRDARRDKRERFHAEFSVDNILAVVKREVMPEEVAQMISVHEAGHVIVALDQGLDVGSVDFDRKRTEYITHTTPTRTVAAGILRTKMGARAAETIVLGECGLGCTADLSTATAFARAMLFEAGDAGLVHYSPEAQFWPDQIGKIERVLNAHYQDALAIVSNKRTQVIKLAARLRRERYLDGDEIRQTLRFDKAAFRRSFEARYETDEARYAERPMDPRQDDGVISYS